MAGNMIALILYVAVLGTALVAVRALLNDYSRYALRRSMEREKELELLQRRLALGNRAATAQKDDDTGTTYDFSDLRESIDRLAG